MTGRIWKGLGEEEDDEAVELATLMIERASAAFDSGDDGAEAGGEGGKTVL